MVVSFFTCIFYSVLFLPVEGGAHRVNPLLGLALLESPRSVFQSFLHGQFPFQKFLVCLAAGSPPGCNRLILVPLPGLSSLPELNYFLYIMRSAGAIASEPFGLVPCDQFFHLW